MRFGHSITISDAEGMAKDAADSRPCSCYPGERPEPCERKFASRDCWRSAVLKETQASIVALKNRDRQIPEQALLDYLMRVREALDQ